MKGMLTEDTDSPVLDCRKRLSIPVLQGPLKSCSEPSLSSTSSSATPSPTKLTISRADVSESDVRDDIFPKKLSRGISRATDNVSTVFESRGRFH